MLPHSKSNGAAADSLGSSSRTYMTPGPWLHVGTADVPTLQSGEAQLPYWQDPDA
jgi:hypothetical protein